MQKTQRTQSFNRLFNGFASQRSLRFNKYLIFSVPSVALWLILGVCVTSVLKFYTFTGAAGQLTAGSRPAVEKPAVSAHPNLLKIALKKLTHSRESCQKNIFFAQLQKITYQFVQSNTLSKLYGNYYCMHSEH